MQRLSLNAFQAWEGEPLQLIPSQEQTCTFQESKRDRILNTDQLIVSSPQVHLSIQKAGIQFEISAPWWGNPSPPGEPRSFWGLWEYEVIEIFIVGALGHYLEIEISPHAHHLLLYLNAPRKIAQTYEIFSFNCDRNLKIQTKNQQLDDPNSAWFASGLIPREFLPQVQSIKTGESFWQVNSFWCFETRETRFHCCAYTLPGPIPDFHQPQHFPFWYFESGLFES